MSGDPWAAPDALLGLAESGVRRALAAGADEAEVFVWLARRHAVEHSGRHAHGVEADQSGVSVRLVARRRVSSAASSGIGPGDVDWIIASALQSAAATPPHPTFVHLPDPMPVNRAPTSVDPALLRPDVDRMLGDVSAAAEVASRAPSISYFNATLEAQASLFAVANSRGVSAWDQNAYESLRVEARAAGAAADKYASETFSDRQPISAAHSPATAAASATARALEAVSPRGLPGLVHDVIFDATTAMQVLTHFTSAFSASALLKGRNPLGGGPGDLVASEILTIRDEPLGPRGCRNQRVDDEGTPTRPLALVERGVLGGFLHDSQTAIEAGVPANGHGLRPLDARYAGGLGIRPTNLEVEPGPATLDEMVEAAPRAVLVRDFLMGTFAMNNLTGDFSFVAPLAYFVENGKIAHPLVATTVAGNLFEAMRNVVAVGRDTRPLRPGRSVPMRLAGLTCAT